MNKMACRLTTKQKKRKGKYWQALYNVNDRLTDALGSLKIKEPIIDL